VSNTPAYFGKGILTAVKKIMIQAPEVSNNSQKNSFSKTTLNKGI
jgi:hypothetical protein